MFEVRFYLGVPSVEGANFEARRFLGREEPKPDRVECNSSVSTQAKWNDPGPVRFGYAFKMLQPFVDKNYRTLDELGADLLRAGIPLIDLRKTVGFVRDGDHFKKLLETHSLERYRDEITFIRRHPDGTHDDIWLLAQKAFDPLRWYKVIRRATAHSTRRQAWVKGAVSLDDLNGFSSKWIREAFGPPPPSPPQIPTTQLPEPPPERMPEPEVFRLALPPSDVRLRLRPPRSPVVDVTPVVAEDLEGNPITELEISRERTRTVPRNMPPNLIPDALDDCSDRVWEKLMLIEQIRFRRQMLPKRAIG